jgi:hypothetical protein
MIAGNSIARSLNCSMNCTRITLIMYSNSSWLSALISLKSVNLSDGIFMKLTSSPFCSWALLSSYIWSKVFCPDINLCWSIILWSSSLFLTMKVSSLLSYWVILLWSSSLIIN